MLSGCRLVGTKVKTKWHGNHGRVVGGNRSLLSFAAATNDSLSTKVLTAEISFTNFIAQHNLPFLANYIREDRKFYSVLQRPSRRAGIIIPLFYTHINCGHDDPSSFLAIFIPFRPFLTLKKKSIENLQNQEEIRKTMNSSTNRERNHLATLRTHTSTHARTHVHTLSFKGTVSRVM